MTNCQRLAFYTVVVIFYRSLLKQDDFDDELLRDALIDCSNSLYDLARINNNTGVYEGFLNGDAYKMAASAINKIISPFLKLCGTLTGAVTRKKELLLMPEPVKSDQTAQKMCCTIL